MPLTRTNGGGGGSLTVKDEGTTLSSAVTSIDFVGAGVTATGTTTLTAGAGVTIRNASSLTTRAQYSTVSLRKTATTSSSRAVRHVPRSRPTPRLTSTAPIST